MATDNAAGDTAAPMMTLDRSNGSATIDLYRAALGPVHTDYYLKAFTRFDAAGKPGTSWNWTAALLTVNWLLFRQLWLPALSYVGALTAAVLLLFGIGPLVFQLSQSSQWALGAVTVLLAFALPGARANAWLYAACNTKMQAALAASATLEEACALLERKASARKQLLRIAAGNLALFGLTAALMLAWPDSGALPLQTQAMQQTRLAPALPTEAASTPVPGRTSQGPVQAAQAPAPVAAPLVATPPVPVPLPSPVPAPDPEPKPAPTPKPTATPKPAKPVALVASAPARGDSYVINVGLFADPNNARNAYTKLRDAGLPATTQALKSAKGQPRTRVRAGPFDSQAEAERAADSIRALRLDAAVLRQ